MSYMLKGNVSRGDPGVVGKRRVATFSGRLVQADLKSVVRNRHYIWRLAVSPPHPDPHDSRYIVSYQTT